MDFWHLLAHNFIAHLSGFVRPKVEVQQGHVLLPSWENGCQVGTVGNRQTKIRVLRMKCSIVENVSTPQESIFKLSPASQRPSGQK